MTTLSGDPAVARSWRSWLDERRAEAREELIVHYSPLVKFVAGRVGAGLPSSVDAGDLIGSGMFGLIDAIDRFDPTHDVKFETFAVPRIRGAVYDGLRQLDWVPRSVRARARRVEQAFAAFEHEQGRSPSDDELATHLGITEAELARWLSSIADAAVGPLDRAIDAGLEPAADEGPGSSAPSARLEDRELSDGLRAEVRRLPDREKLVLSLYYDEGLTLAEIGDVLGITASRVSQIRSKSVIHLRTRLTASGVV